MQLSTFTRYVLIGVLFPLLIQFVMYYRYTPNYQPGIYSENGFRTFFESSVFKYRVAGSAMLYWVYHQLKSHSSEIPFKEDKTYGKRLLALDDQADPLFYLSIYVINAFFAMLFAISMLYLFDRKHFYDLTDSGKSFSTVLVLLMVAVSQFVTTPYDVPAYFFEVISFLAFLKYLQTEKLLYFFASCLLISLATLIRESSAIILCLMAAVYFLNYGLDLKWIKKMILPGMTFILTYFGLHIFVNRQNTVQMVGESKLANNFNLHPTAIMGVLMAVIIVYLMLQAALSPENKKLVRVFLLFTTPYILTIIFVGMLLEFRLWLPLIIGTAMLYKLNLKEFSKPL